LESGAGAGAAGAPAEVPVGAPVGGGAWAPSHGATESMTAPVQALRMS
jgi:hypothetical protein